MIIVLPNAGGNNGYGKYGEKGDPFYTDLTVDIKNYVEKNYKADTTRFARAISGLSMGSMQTWNLTLFYPKLWGYSLPMSAGLFKSSGFSASKLKSDVASGLIDTASINQLKLFNIYSNPTDIAYGDTDTTAQLMDALKITHTTDWTRRHPADIAGPFGMRYSASMLRPC
jgi:S-formylglutathione hydrolase FrmB